MEDQERKKMLSTATRVAHYVPATLRENDRWYIEFGYQLCDGSMKRSRHYINCVVKRMKTIKEKRAYAANEIDVLNQKLRAGWTPEMDKALASVPKSGTPLLDVTQEYRRWVASSEEKGELRHATSVSYASMINIFEAWVKKHHIDRVYELKDDHVRQWLMDAQESGVSVKTQQNYRRWLRSWCNWAIERNYMRENITAAVKVEASSKEVRNQAKRRDAKYIEPLTRTRIFKWCEEHDRQLLLASMLEYYCFVRPREMMQLELGLFHVDDGMLFIPDRISKNGRDAWVTVPDVVYRLMIDMKVFDHDADCLLFGHGLNPCKPKKANRGDEIRDRWLEMRKALGLSERVKFYNLKHTGITDMMERVKNPRIVQLQARHHSIQQTEAYAQQHKPAAFEEIRHLE